MILLSLHYCCNLETEILPKATLSSFSRRNITHHNAQITPSKLNLSHTAYKELFG